jgi:hypothetical protein
LSAIDRQVKLGKSNVYDSVILCFNSGGGKMKNFFENLAEQLLRKMEASACEALVSLAWLWRLSHGRATLITPNLQWW